MKLDLSLSVVMLAVVFGMSSASAARPSMVDCGRLAAQVTQAIRDGESWSNVTAARNERSTGAYYCGLGSYAKGIEHYNQALALLGQKQTPTNAP